ncbi:hypothetical protein BDV36DRAFT_279751 [Aspergillus pseudocaelatus]|uniref:Uncharacterized protein n=1 Tax=Aspergillus pseudocaelatus TaxID=1825620 RepID=A0ABQ6WZV2_9EURO|nr:hypothetical protein BDV36DRAFT_279751 [Aspergillus pseudocaelatus]
MAVVLGRKMRKLIVGLHRYDFAFSEHLPGSLQILDECSPNALERTNNPRPVVGFAIPNIVHLIWKTTDVQEYSTEITASRASWRATLEPSNYTVKLWTDDDVLELIMANYTWLLPTYNEYPHDIQRADLARLLIVHTEHLQCLQTLSLQAIFSRTAGTLGLSNHFFMAKPGSPFLRWVLYEAKRRSSRLASRGMILPYLQMFWSTGPIMVTAAAARPRIWWYGGTACRRAVLAMGGRRGAKLYCGSCRDRDNVKSCCILFLLWWDLSTWL